MQNHFLAESLDLIDQLITQLDRRVYQQIWRREPVGMTQSQFALCKLVKWHGRMTVSDLAGSLGVSLSAITLAADKLCQAGLMERQRDEGDRRVVRLALTGEGERVVTGILEIWHRTLQEYFALLTVNDREKLVELCTKLLQIMGAEDQDLSVQEEA